MIKTKNKLRDEDIRKGNIKLETDKLHQLQEAYLIANQLAWLKSLSENLRKATLKYNDILEATPE